MLYCSLTDNQVKGAVWKRERLAVRQNSIGHSVIALQVGKAQIDAYGAFCPPDLLGGQAHAAASQIEKQRLGRHQLGNDILILLASVAEIRIPARKDLLALTGTDQLS